MLASAESDDELERRPGVRGPMGLEENVRLGATTHSGPYLSLPRSSPSRFRSERGAHPAAWATGALGPRSQRSVPYTCAASSFSAETGGSLNNPSPGLTSPKDAEEWKGVEASFPFPSTWAGAQHSPPYLGSYPEGQSESLWGGGRWRLHLAAGGKESGGTEGEVRG